MSLMILEGDTGIREFLREYKGCNATWEFVGDVQGEGDDENERVDVAVGMAGTEAVDVCGGVGVCENQNEGVAGIKEVDMGEGEGDDGNEGVNVNKNEGVVGTEEVSEGEGEGDDGNDGVNVNENVGVAGTGEVDVGECEGEGSELESNFNASSASECPSRMLEDLEAPWDDDIFTNRPENYTRTMLKTLSSFIKEKREKRHEDKQTQRGEGSGRGVEQWFSDCEEEQLRSVRGSDDEGERCPEWDEMMDMGEVDLAVGMKFERRMKCRDVIRDWAVRRGWDLKFLKNGKHLMIATCKNECNWKLRASSVMKSTTFQIKSIKGGHTCAHKIMNKQANAKYIGKRIEPFLRYNPTE
ncbi:UNVERIFIED_CONTAM: hypothetical protein Slati_1437200 [Sesamum latifolium]|uniref:Transposase MuDR plant domain-containing protein n=1 Tax=Sesamum latifolium TaxID=2727402 RepID=A0AAW2X4W2_9LAMI